MMKILLILSLFLLSSCNLKPKYEAPEIKVTLPEIKSDKVHITEVSWQEFFDDEELKVFINRVLMNNNELKVANLNIDLLKKNHAISIADLLPKINAGGQYSRRNVPGSFRRFTATRQYNLNVALLSYELDFFGRLRNLKESALENYLASKEARKIIKLSLISQAVDGYLTLVLDRELLKISQASLGLQQLRYDLINKRYQAGVANVSDELTARLAVQNAKIDLEEDKNKVLKDENRLLNLLSSYDRALLPVQDVRILHIKSREDLLEFVVSKTLLQRPDIIQAENRLRSANALVGVARAAFFPSISLSGDYGYASLELDNLTDSSSWNFVPKINVPLFDGGKNKATLDIAKLRKEVEIINYEQVIQNAFEETFNALQDRKTLAFQAKSFAKILKSKSMLFKLAKRNKKHGLVSKIEVIEAKLAYLEAKRSYLRSEKDYSVSLVNIYKAFGGGTM